jgi:hypothetical protein
MKQNPQPPDKLQHSTEPLTEPFQPPMKANPHLTEPLRQRLNRHQ